MQKYAIKKIVGSIRRGLSTRNRLIVPAYIHLMNHKIPNVRRNTIRFFAIGFGFFAIIIVAFIFLPIHESDIPFDKGQWEVYGDDRIDGGLRNRMLNNLLECHFLTGLSYHQLIDLLGEPDDKSGRIEYLIKATYDVIDPD